MKAKINRKSILENLLKAPEGADANFWKREMTFLKRLEKKYGLAFLKQFVPNKKVPTLAFFYADWQQKLLETESKEFYYKNLHKADLSKVDKVGEDAEVKPKKTIKGFLS